MLVEELRCIPANNVLTTFSVEICVPGLYRRDSGLALTIKEDILALLAALGEAHSLAFRVCPLRLL